MSHSIKSVLLALCFSAVLPASALATEQTGELPAIEVLLYGDSLAAGYGLAPEEALAFQLERRLERQLAQQLAGGPAVNVQNGGVSGDTTAGGLSRLGWTLQGRVDLVILILGGNDAMRGLTPAQTEDNLDRLITELKSRDCKVLLTGMRAPPNLGTDYAAAFEPMYARLAKKHGIALYPFILEGVAADRSLNQEDGIHPNAEGVAVIVSGLVPLISRLLAP